MSKWVEKEETPLFKNTSSVSQKKARSWRGKVCTYCIPCLSLSRPPMRRDHHWRLRLVETLHHTGYHTGYSNTKKSQRIKNGWKKKEERALYKKYYQCRSKGRREKKKWNTVYVLESMVVTFPTCQAEMSALKLSLLEKTLDISVTKDVFQSSIGP